MIALHVAFFVAIVVYTMYVWGWAFRILGEVIHYRVWEVGNAVCCEVRPLAFVAIPMDALHDLATNPINFWSVLVVLVHAGYFYACLKDNRDDRWKRRRKKVTGKVKEVAGKLVVVPEPATSAA